jgi:hypothetical protein
MNSIVLIGPLPVFDSDCSFVKLSGRGSVASVSEHVGVVSYWKSWNLLASIGATDVATVSGPATEAASSTSVDDSDGGTPGLGCKVGSAEVSGIGAVAESSCADRCPAG